MFELVVLSPTAAGPYATAIAATRAGLLGVADLTFASDPAAALASLEPIARLHRDRWGIQTDDAELLEAVLAADLDGLDTVLACATGADALSVLVERVNAAGLRALAVATDVEQAVAAQAAGASAVIAKGHESGGWIGDEGAFVLLQRIAAEVKGPVLVQGGIGAHTIAAAHVAGAVGAVLDAQVLLASDSGLGRDERAMLINMDGSETQAPGAELGAAVRVHARPGLARLSELWSVELGLSTAAVTEDTSTQWRTAVRAAIGDGTLAGGLLPIGQDACLAAPLAERFGTVSGIAAGLLEALAHAAGRLAAPSPLAEGSALAEAHGTRYPIAQGPMTRVSDRAEFAAAVADAGALPFLALALLRGDEVDALLTRTAQLAGAAPWGVGILGFVPPELRSEQLEVVRRHRPPFALIAGGRPDQAHELEQIGIKTYLHVPSPGLLRLYLAQGARRFVLEGRECGGHVGPRTSFVLWESMLEVLLEQPAATVAECDILFAGGVHDARSAAMVAATAASATARGLRCGVLMGTAYLFTAEAVSTGAVTATFQQAAIDAERTALLESGPGHATRCLRSPFVGEFGTTKRRLRTAGLEGEELRHQLEELNIGRLRVAAKGTDRNPAYPSSTTAPKLLELDPAAQWSGGLYMIGQVAAMHRSVTTLAELHADVSEGGSELLRALPAQLLAVASAPPPPPQADIAIVGIGCILPGAPDVDTYWTNILNKVDAIGEVPPERWDWKRNYDPDPATPDRVNSRWGGFIDAVEFDPIANGMPPKSLSSIEPFQLLALKTAQAALADAGYAKRPFARERTSVILGAGGGGADLSVGYTVRSMLPTLFGDGHPELQEQIAERLPEWTEDSFAGLLMNVAAGRIANRLDLGGTNFTVDAACASSLAAIALAVRELQAGTSDMVLAGGLDAIQNPFAFLCFAKTRALSPRGRCRPFDASADGIAISEGFATIALKRREDAERDGDRIYAVIRGVGAASDGRDRSLTAPRPEGQMLALERAYAQARVSPATVGLVEAHGTGTVAGDGAEVKALTQVFAAHGTPAQACAIGSVKSMIGHTKATAGVAGLAKAALALHHRVLPPTLGVTEPNPQANFPESPFYINSEARPWLDAGGDHPRRAGVSAFGFGGTNFHVVLEEYTDGYLAEASPPLRRWPAEVFLWRGAPAGIVASVDALLARLDAEDQPPGLPELAAAVTSAAPPPGGDAATLAIVAESIEALREKLQSARGLLESGDERVHAPNGIHFSRVPLAEHGRVAFLFPGQGSQVVDMGRDIALAFNVAREPFELADHLLADAYERPLSHYILPPPSFSEEESAVRQQQLTDTHVAQVALGVAELAYLRVLAELGVVPEMTAGHSYGELVALAAAGALDDSTLLRLSEARGRLMADAAAGAPGAMAAVDCAPEALAPLLAMDDALVVANINGPTQTVLSGPTPSVERAVEWCTQAGMRARALSVSCAFHSPHVAGAQRRFATELRRAEVGAARIPVYSNTTAQPHGEAPGDVVRVLSRHLAEPVDFANEIEQMHADGARIFVEVGPRSVLSGLTDRILEHSEHLAVPVDRSGRPALVQLLHCLATLASEGVAVRFDRLIAMRGIARTSLERVRPEAGAPTAGWLIDGGRVRRADVPASAIVPVAESPVRAAPAAADAPAADQAVIVVPVAPRSEAEALVPAVTAAAVAALPPTPAPPPAPSPLRAVPAQPPSPRQESIPVTHPSANGNGHHPPPGADRVAEVMVRYQQLMQQFLETEREIMLGYLQGSSLPTSAQTAPPLITAPAPMPPLFPPIEPISPPVALPAQPAPADRGEPMAAAAEQAQAAPAIIAPEPVAAPPAPNGSAAPAIVAPEPVADPPALNGSAAIVAPEPVASTSAANGSLNRDAITSRLLEIVSDRTGYPAEMLALDADLEGDLGIDSIKRVEIAGTFTQTLAEEQRAGIDMEELTTCRTLDAVIATLERGIEASAAAKAVSAPFEQRPADSERIRRYVVAAASAPAVVSRAGLAGGKVVIAGADTALSARLAAALDAVILAPPLLPSDEAEATELAGRLIKEHRSVSALVHLGDGGPLGGVESLHLLTRALASELDAAAYAGGAALVALHGQAESRAVAGYLKSLAHEWPAVRVKAIGFADPGGDVDAVAAAVLAELHADDGVVEVAYRGLERTSVTLVDAALGERSERAELDETSVVLITGGARGITAEAATALAERYRPMLVLIGRTPLAREPEETAQHADPMALRRALIEARRAAGETPAPAAIEADCRRILRAREVRANVSRMERAGARVEYLACDVSDSAEFASLIAGVYARHGRIDGVIHGAGVIEDRLVVDKELASMRRVLAAKAGSAATLAANLRHESLRFLVLFSSVSGRFGNRGQADYAAASEALAGLAAELDRSTPARVVAIAWGPWAGVGMAAPLETEFAARGVSLIQPAVGTRMLLEEIARGRKGETEVVIGAARGIAAEPPARSETGFALLADVPAAASRAQLHLTRRLTLERDLYLDDHRVDGRPVLPFAVAMELMGEAALLAEPEQTFAALHGIRVFAGITVPEDEGATVELRADARGQEVDLQIVGSASGRVHYRAVAQLGTAGTAAPAPPDLDALAAFPLEIPDAYRELLFHGPLFQAITSIAGLDERGASATLRASDPAACVATSAGRPWLIDPVMIDSALQMQVVWARLCWDVTLLPAEIASCERFALPRPGELVRHELRLRPESSAPMCHCDHWFLREDGSPLVIMRDVVGVGSRALNRLATVAA